METINRLIGVGLVFLIVSTLISLLSSSTALAQDATQPTVEPASVYVVADVSVHRPSIVFSDDQIITTGFRVSNGSEASQSDIRYGLQIQKKDDLGRSMIVDVYIPDEPLTLGPKEVVYREMTYQIPKTLSGEYEVWVYAKTGGGLPLGFGKAGTVMFSGSSSYVEVVPETCSLNVQGDDAKYSLLQGVDLTANETLSLVCTLVNHGDSPVVLTPNFTTHWRSMFGDIVKTSEVAQQEISLAPGIEKQVSVVIPKAVEPQAYDVSTVFIAKETNEEISNKIIAHYVLQGGSATIQNVTFDKAGYRAGEELTAELFWSPSADLFPDSRQGEGTVLPAVYLTLSVVDAEGKECLSPATTELSQETYHQVVSLPVLIACIQPKGSVTLTDSAGNILDTRIVETPPPPEGQSGQDTLSEKTNGISGQLLYIVLIFSGVLVLVLIRHFRKNSKGPDDGGHSSSVTLGAFFFWLILASGMGVGRSAEAVTFSVVDNYAANYGTTIYATVNLDDTTYGTNDTVTTNWSFYYGGCGNESGDGWLYGAIDNANPQSNPANLYGTISEGTRHTLFGTDWYDNASVSGIKTYSTNGLTVGAHQLNLYIRTVFDGWRNFSGSSYIDFTVAQPNQPPTTPTITPSGANTYLTGSNQTFTLNATDPDGDQIRYGIDWDDNGSVDQWTPTGGVYVNSGTNRNVNHSWSSPGTYTFKVRAQDSLGNNSAWRNRTVTITDPAPCALPWGGSVASGVDVTAYQSATVPYGSSCTSETRTCNNGTLSGSYANENCTVLPAPCAAGTAVSWIVGGNTCNGTTPAASSGASGAVTDSIAPTTGSAAFACTDGTWAATPNAGATCTLASYSLIVSKVGSGNGTVTSSPAGINCGADCSEPYSAGTVVTLTATPDSSSDFIGWSGACTGTGVCVVTVDAIKTAIATFDPKPNCGITPPDADGNTYETVVIGTQCWMKENMRVGTMVNTPTVASNNAVTEKYCFQNDVNNCNDNHPNYPDGGMYAWNEAMQYSNVEGGQGICPAGWHIPTDAEWHILENYLTDGVNTCDSNRSTATPGGAYDCANTGNKLIPGGSSGFEGNIAGSYWFAFCTMAGCTRDRFSYFWTSSERDAGSAWYRVLSPYTSEANEIARISFTKEASIPVRCVQGAGAAAQPDLTATNLNPAASASFLSTSAITFTGTANNSFAASVTEGGWADLEIDWNSDGGLKTDGVTGFDENHDAYGGVKLGAFTPGQAKNLSYTIPANTAPVGTHRYRFHVDTDGTGVVESDETNNRSTWQTFTITAPSCPSGTVWNGYMCESLIGSPLSCTDDSTSISDTAQAWTGSWYGTPQAIMKVGNYVYAGASGLSDTQGLYVFDVSDPANITQRSFFSTYNPASVQNNNSWGNEVLGLDVEGGYAYLATYYGGLVIVNVSNPSSPTFVGKLPLYPGSRETWDVEVVGNYAYMAAGKGLIVVNVTDKANPVMVADVDISGGVSQDILVSGNYAYIAMRDSGFAVVDVSDPTNPVVRSHVTSGYGGSTWAYGMEKRLDILYVADHYAGQISYYNVSNPSLPVLLGTVPAPNPSGVDSPRELYISGDVLYASAGRGGLYVFDITNPAAPVELFSVLKPPLPATAKVWGVVPLDPTDFTELAIISEDTTSNIGIYTTKTDCVPRPDLTSSFNISGTFTQNVPISLNATVWNSGIADASSFSDNFSYSWDGSNWTDITPFVAHSALTQGASAPDTGSYTPNTTGTLWLQHCVDSNHEINEGANETPNCTQHSVTVVPPAQCPAGETLSWTVGSDSCSSDTASPKNSGESLTVLDAVADPATGQAAFDCRSDGTWDPAPTAATCAVPPPPAVPIGVAVSVDRELIRVGETAEITIDVNISVRATCTVYGVNLTPFTFLHSGVPAAQSYTYTTRALSATQIVTVSCVSDPVVAGVVAGRDEQRIEVVPKIEER